MSMRSTKDPRDFCPGFNAMADEAGSFVLGKDDVGCDFTLYGDTSGSSAFWDASADELVLNGADLWMKDDDQIEFGDVSDVVIDWDNANTRLLFSVTGGNLEVIRNSTSGATDEAVVYILQDNASDDKPALKLAQDATGYAALDVDGGVDIDSAFTGTALDVNRNLTSGATSTAVVRIVQDNSGDDQAALEITQDCTTALALDANGWCDIGYSTNDPTGNVATGAVRVVYNNSRWWLAVSSDGAGTFLYTELATTSTA